MLKELLERGQKAFDKYDYAKAMQSYRGALAIAQALGDDRQAGISYGWVARTFYRMSRFDEARSQRTNALGKPASTRVTRPTKLPACAAYPTRIPEWDGIAKPSPPKNRTASWPSNWATK
ncbi:hypothetical protein SBA3_220038 [Candidatus Sulfopaludibacter sp. SbA3]|nr:hypothetical protein SBA3_220038 [Candidatus Sulfopaludibacter sp. SbA3]